jgi:hypothetical protein
MNAPIDIQGCKPRNRRKSNPQLFPYKLCMRDIEFLAWVVQAEPGDRLEYHRGFLAVDLQSMSATPSEQDRKALGQLAQKARGAFELGLVHLVQERLAIDRFSYIAIARPRQKTTITTTMLSALLLNEAA